jgi:hypothetical protein
MRTLSNSSSAQRRQSIDVLVQHYVSWREECYAVADAYQRWDRCARGQREAGYAAYIAALDREEHAAGVYAEQIEHVKRIPV